MTSTLQVPTYAFARSVSDSAWRVERVGKDIVLITNTAETPQPHDWLERLRATHNRLAASGVVAVGAKRLIDAEHLFSMGEFIIHPKGFHHLGRGLPAHCYRFPEEVDAIDGGIMMANAPAFDRVHGEALLQGSLGAIELCLSLRTAGGRCITVPDVTIRDAQIPQPMKDETVRFRNQWGFDWQAADLDGVRARHFNSGLLWNVRLHGQALPFGKYDERPAMHWKSYEEVPSYRKRADHLVNLTRQHTLNGKALDLGCGDGLFTHLLACAGIEAIGIDAEAPAIEQARTMCNKRHATGKGPTFQVGDATALPFKDESFQSIVMFDVIEHLPNPVAVLREAQRVLAPSGHLIVSTPSWQYGAWSDPVYHVCEYTLEELVGQIHAATELKVGATGKIGGVYRDLVVMAKKDAGSIRRPN